MTQEVSDLPLHQKTKRLARSYVYISACFIRVYIRQKVRIFAFISFVLYAFSPKLLHVFNTLNTLYILYGVCRLYAGLGLNILETVEVTRRSNRNKQQDNNI